MVIMKCKYFTLEKKGIYDRDLHTLIKLSRASDKLRWCKKTQFLKVCTILQNTERNAKVPTNLCFTLHN